MIHPVCVSCLAFFSPVARKIPFDDPLILNYVRLGYVLSQVVIIGTYFFVSYKVSQPFLVRVEMLSGHVIM